MTEEYVFWISWERVPIDSSLYSGKIEKIKQKIISSAQNATWDIVTKSFFGMIKYKPTSIEYKENVNRIYQSGTREECEKLLQDWERVEPASLSAIKSRFSRVIPPAAKKHGELIKSKYNEGKGTGIERFIDTLSHVMIFVEYGICLELDLPSLAKTDVNKEQNC